MSKKNNVPNKKHNNKISPIAEHKKVEKPAQPQPEQRFTQEEMSKKKVTIPGGLWFDILTYLNSRPRVESNQLCMGLEQLSAIVEPEKEKKSIPDSEGGG